MKETPIITTIGGGTGTYPVLAALQRCQADIGAVVAMADSGGSSGRLRDEFGFPPVGDVRQSLTAIADSKSQDWIKQLLLYRFKQGSGLEGHSLGNLLLTALQDLTGSTTEALEIAAHIFQLSGTVIPITDDPVSLVIHYADGTMVTGEHRLDDPEAPTKTISHISFEPEARPNPRALHRLRQSDIVIIGPGDLYASIHAVLQVSGVHSALAHVPHIVFICNLMNKQSQTHQFTAQDHVASIETAIKRPVNTILLNSGSITAQTRKSYDQSGDTRVVDNLGSDPRAIRTKLVTAQTRLAGQQQVLRHDPDLLFTALTQSLKLKAKAS